jgi:hypothetical protein
MGLDAAYGGNLQLSPAAEFCTTVLKRSAQPANLDKLLRATSLPWQNFLEFI